MVEMIKITIAPENEQSVPVHNIKERTAVDPGLRLSWCREPVCRESGRPLLDTLYRAGELLSAIDYLHSNSFFQFHRQAAPVDLAVWVAWQFLHAAKCRGQHVFGEDLG